MNFSRFLKILTSSLIVIGTELGNGFAILGAYRDFSSNSGGTISFCLITGGFFITIFF